MRLNNAFIHGILYRCQTRRSDTQWFAQVPILRAPEAIFLEECLRRWPDWAPRVITAPFNNTRTLIQSSTNKCVFCYRQSSVWRLLPASDYCRTLFGCLDCAQLFDYHSLGSCRKLGGAAEHLIDGSGKRICWLSFEF